MQQVLGVLKQAESKITRERDREKGRERETSVSHLVLTLSDLMLTLSPGGCLRNCGTKRRWNSKLRWSCSK